MPCEVPDHSTVSPAAADPAGRNPTAGEGRVSAVRGQPLGSESTFQASPPVSTDLLGAYHERLSRHRQAKRQGNVMVLDRLACRLRSGSWQAIGQLSVSSCSRQVAIQFQHDERDVRHLLTANFCPGASAPGPQDHSPQAACVAHPTGCVLFPELPPYHPYCPNRFTPFPKWYTVCVPARTAYSHSASVGSRYERTYGFAAFPGPTQYSAPATRQPR